MSTSLSTNRCAMVCYVLRMIATGESMKCLEIPGLMHHSAERCIWGVEERSSRIALRSIRATDSIPIVLDLQQRERAEHVRRIGGRRRAQVGTIELGETRHAEQAERALHLVLDELEHAHDAGLPGRSETVTLHAAEPDEIRAQDHRLADIGAAAERAVDHDFRAAGNRLDDLGQHLHRAEAVIELPA